MLERQHVRQRFTRMDGFTFFAAPHREQSERRASAMVRIGRRGRDWLAAAQGAGY
jgi:hypothetical protein